MLQASQALHQLLLLKPWPWGCLFFYRAQAIFICFQTPS